MDIPVRKKDLVFLAAALILTVIFTSPWLFRAFVGIEHDTYFHLSRIDALSEALFHGDFIPRIYPYENNGFGYASPMFYSDFFLVIPAVFYHFGMPLSSSYVLMMFLTVFAGTFTMMHACEKICGDSLTSILCGSAYCFANYHITDIYVRSAVGEAMALVFLPVQLEGLYLLFECRDQSGWKPLFIGMTGLLLTHNLTFLLACILTGAFFLIYFSKLPKEIFFAFLRAGMLSFLCTVFFSLPMAEQLLSQKFYLHWYAGGSDLAGYALPLWKYFVNTTVFGYGSNDLDRNLQMTVNVGIFLSLMPLLWIFVKEKKHALFVNLCLIFGYICMILPWDAFPWDHMAALRILQFPWRLFTLALPLLAIVSAAGLSSLLKQRKPVLLVLLLLVCGEGIFHVLPAFERTYGITSKMNYSFLINGGLPNPYYSATYVRIQLAGGEYLPQSSPDFRELEPMIWTSDGSPAGIGYDKNRTRISFTASSLPEDGILELPLTYYLGYTVRGKNGEAAELFPSRDALIRVHLTAPGTYAVRYSGTPLQHVTAVISLLAWVITALLFIKGEDVFSAFSGKTSKNDASNSFQ